MLNVYKCIRRLFTSRQERIKGILNKELSPVVLEIVNESYKHSVPQDAETHFKLTIVSDKFKSMSSVQAHRMVYKLLEGEMGEKSENKLHAISLVAKASTDCIPHHKTPNCMNRIKH